MHMSCSVWKSTDRSGAGSSQPGNGDVQAYMLCFSTSKSNRSEFVFYHATYIGSITLCLDMYRLFTILSVIQFTSKDQTWGYNPLALLGEREIINFFFLRYLENCIPLGFVTYHSKVNASLQLSMFPKASSSFSDGGGAAFLLFCLCVFIIVMIHRWPSMWFKFAFNHKMKPAAACV